MKYKYEHWVWHVQRVQAENLYLPQSATNKFSLPFPVVSWRCDETSSKDM